MAIKSHFKGSYDKQNLTLVVIYEFMKLPEMTTGIKPSINEFFNSNEAIHKKMSLTMKFWQIKP